MLPYVYVGRNAPPCAFNGACLSVVASGALSAPAKAATQRASRSGTPANLHTAGRGPPKGRLQQRDGLRTGQERGADGEDAAEGNNRHEERKVIPH